MTFRRPCSSWITSAAAPRIGDHPTGMYRPVTLVATTPSTPGTSERSSSTGRHPHHDTLQRCPSGGDAHMQLGILTRYAPRRYEARRSFQVRPEPGHEVHRALGAKCCAGVAGRRRVVVRPRPGGAVQCAQGEVV